MASDTFLGTTYGDLDSTTPTNSDSIGVTAAAIRQIKSFLKDDSEGTDVSMHGLKNFIKQLVLTDKDIKQNFIENIYKVNDIILTLDKENPSKRFGGTWELIKDKFLLGAGGDFSLESIGGEREHTLTIEEMPKHNHVVKNILTSGAYGMFTSGGYAIKTNVNTTEVGEDKPHNNMPPYIAVYIWKKTK